jgi:hypothetical protein
MSELTYTKKMLAIIGQTDLPSALKLSSPAKVSNTKSSAFSLPAGSDFSCAGETSVCRDACYAKAKRHQFSNVQKLMASNWALIRDLEASKSSAIAVQRFLEVIPEKAKIMRIHESGDFHSQWYIDVWAEVVKARPNTKFWFYTRCFQFDFSVFSKFDNVACWASTDSANEVAALAFVAGNSFFKHAWGPLAKDEKPENTVMCPVTTGKLEMAGACNSCRLCVERNRIKKNIGFVMH